MKATNEWKNFKSLADAKSAVKNFSRKNKSKIRSSNRIASISGSEDQKSESTNEQVGDLLHRLSNKEILIKPKLEPV